MLGDDPEPTVKTEWVGFGQVSDAQTRGVWLSRSRGKQKPDWSGTVSAGKAIRGKVMKAKGRNGNDERMQVLRK